MSDKVYCGSGIEKFDGNLVEISVCVSDLPKDKIFEYNGKKYIKLKVVKKREVDQYNKTHYVEVDMFEPKKKEESPAIEWNKPLPPEFNEPEDEKDLLPF